MSSGSNSPPLPEIRTLGAASFSLDATRVKVDTSARVSRSSGRRSSDEMAYVMSSYSATFMMKMTES